MNSSTPAKFDEAETSFFLDSIPNEILENVLRYYSRIPNATKWETYIDVRNLVLAFGVHGVFGTLLKSRFHTLRVSRTKNCNRYEKYLGWKEITEPYLWTSDIAAAHQFVVAGGGESLRTLVISCNMYKRGRDGENLVDDFVNHCPNVTSLSIAEEEDTIWTNKFGNQLETLEVCAGAPVNFPVRVPDLRELNMNTSVGNSDVLSRIGRSLERLVIHEFYDQRDDDVDKMKLHCPNLKSVSLRGRSSEDSPAITRLLASYGERLEYALLYWLNDDQIRDVATACPNARFRVYGGHGFGLSHSCLNLIGPRLEGVRFDYTENVEMDGFLVEWRKAWNQCVNLRHLDFNPTKVEDVQAIISTPKNHLVSIALTSNDLFEREDVKKVMADLTNGTKCVEELMCFGSSYFIDELGGFIEKNRGSLRLISLGGTFSDGNKKLCELLQLFLQLTALEELYVDYDIPQDIQRSLHNNGVDFCREQL